MVAVAAVTSYKERNHDMTLKNIHDTFSSGGYLFIGLDGMNGWQFVGRNIELDNSDFMKQHADQEVNWIYLNEYEGEEGLAVVLKTSSSDE